MSKSYPHDTFEHYMKSFGKEMVGRGKWEREAFGQIAIAAAILTLSFQIEASFPPPSTFPRPQ